MLGVIDRSVVNIRRQILVVRGTGNWFNLGENPCLSRGLGFLGREFPRLAAILKSCGRVVGLGCLGGEGRGCHVISNDEMLEAVHCQPLPENVRAPKVRGRLSCFFLLTQLALTSVIPWALGPKRKKTQSLRDLDARP